MRTTITLAMVGVLTLTLMLPAYADGNRYDTPIGVECSPDGTSVIVAFDVAQDHLAWSLTQGTTLAYTDTDSARPGRWVQVVNVTPDVEFTVGVETADLGARLEHSWEYVNEAVHLVRDTCVPEVVPVVVPVVTVTDPPATPSPIAEEIYQPTPSLLRLRDFYQDVWRRHLEGAGPLEHS